MKNKKPKFGCILTVRTGSTRLPGKPLLRIGDKMIIEHMIRRMKLVKGVDEIVMCTTMEQPDDILEVIAKNERIGIFRGSTEDKIARWLGAVNKYDFDYFVPVDAGDDIFCDPYLIDLAIKQMKARPCDYLKIPDTLVCGGAAPCISADALKKVFEIKDTDNTEFYPIYFVSTGLFNVREIDVKEPIYHNNKIRLTMDYVEDYELFKGIFNGLAMSENTIPLKNILLFLNENPDLAGINTFRQKDYLENQKKIINLSVKK
jgi:spore coat polysaccharide biosynthesis protein SpsF